MKKFFKWLLYVTGALMTVLAFVFALAYWNKDQLLEKINAYLNQGINGKFHIQKIDFTLLHHFPDFSITLHNVYLRGPRDSVYHRDFFSAKKIFLDIGLYQLLKNEIHIRSLTLDEADLFIFRARDGYRNTDVFKTKVDSSAQKNETSFIHTLEEIEFRNVHFTYADSIKNKSLGFKFLKTNHTLSSTGAQYDMGITGELYFDGLIFNPMAGGFLMRKHALADLHLVLDKLTETITIHPSSLTFEKSTIGITGAFELQKEGDYTLKFASQDLDLEEGKTLVTQKLDQKLCKFTLEKPVDITISLQGKSAPGCQPDVDIQFHSEDTRFDYQKMNFTALTFSGSFTNHLDSTQDKGDNNSQLAITSLTGKMEQLPIQGKAVFTQLRDPVVDLSITTKMPFTTLNEQMDTSRLAFRSGTVLSEISYKGKLTEYLDHTRTKYKGILKGRFTATQASFDYKPRKMHFDKINGQFEFTEKQFTINNLALQLNGDPLRIKGSIQNFIPFFISPESKGYVKLDITSPHLDLTWLAAKEREKKSARQLKQERKKMTDLFDLIYQKLEFDLTLNTERFTFKKFVAENLSGQVRLSNDILEARSITMRVADGKMNLNFRIADLYNPVSPVTLSAEVRNAQVKDFFLCFNDFNQNAIRSGNLSGIVSADIDFSAEINDDYAILAPSMQGRIDCTIRDGGLKDFEPLQNISNFLFKKRDFSDVKFAEIISRFSLRGTAMDISRMEVQSSVLTLFLQGRYSFTDSTSLSLQLPLSNLKKRDKDYKPENIGLDAKTGPSVYLHVSKNKETNNKLAIAYDPFKKWARK